MKKFFYLIIIISLLFSLSGCKNNKTTLPSIEGTWVAEWKNETENGENHFIFDIDGVFINAYINYKDIPQQAAEVEKELYEGSYIITKDDRIMLTTINDPIQESSFCDFENDDKILCEKWPNLSFAKNKYNLNDGKIKKDKIKKLSKAVKIIIIDQSAEETNIKKIITNKVEIEEIIDLISRTKLLDAHTTYMSQNYAIEFLNAENNLITTIGLWFNRKIRIMEGVNEEIYYITNEDAIIIRNLIK